MYLLNRSTVGYRIYKYHIYGETNTECLQSFLLSTFIRTDVSFHRLGSRCRCRCSTCNMFTTLHNTYVRNLLDWQW